MSPKLDRLLVKRYPKIFRDRYKSPQETCMHWGFPEGGWFMLIDILCRCIQRHIDNSESTCALSQKWHNEFVQGIGPYRSEWSPHMNGTTPVPQVVALQVKEKFGTLRFYYSGGDEAIEGMVGLAEQMSGTTCEECGSFSSSVGYTLGWISVICPPCLKKSKRPERPWDLSLENKQAQKAQKP